MDACGYKEFILPDKLVQKIRENSLRNEENSDYFHTTRGNCEVVYITSYFNGVNVKNKLALCHKCLKQTIVWPMGQDTSPCTPPPRLQVDQNFLTQKIVADPKMRCHQKSFGIWRVTEAILGKKTCFFFQKHILEKNHNKSHYFFNF